VFFTDATTVRVLDVDGAAASYAGAAPGPGGVAVVAGGAARGYSGDGGPASLAAFDTPSALANDGLWKLLVADTGNDRVRCVNLHDPASGGSETAYGVAVAAGAVETVVGGATTPLPADGDGLAPRSASLSGPLGISVAPGGVLWIADTGHHRIRAVNPGPADVTVAGVLLPAGSITTVVGTGVAGFTPDGPGPWLVDTPTAVTADAQLVFFADAGNARIRALNVSAATVRVAEVDVAPGEVRTLVGTGVRGNSGDGGEGPSAQVDTPRAFFLQTVGGVRSALYFTDGPQHVLRLLNLARKDVLGQTDLPVAIGPDRRTSATAPGGFVVTLAGGPNTPGVPNVPSFAGDGGEASGMRFDRPWGVVVAEHAGCLAHCFVIDEGNDRARRFGAPQIRSCVERP
jgi:hypothetical protein